MLISSCINYLLKKIMAIDKPVHPVKKKYLEDVAILRLLLIFLLIWNHAFAPYVGHWEPLSIQSNIVGYKWLVLIVYHMRIQALIFISGYLLGYTSLRKPDALLFKNCVIKKIKRLLLPCVIFSALYYVIFYDINHPIGTVAYSIVNGAGHMWFLPMLFWCFTGVYIVERFKIKPIYIFCVAVIVAIIPSPTLPLRLNNSLTYFIFFYTGFGLQRGYFKFLAPSSHNSLATIVLCVIIYFASFAIHYIVIDGRYDVMIFHIVGMSDSVLTKILVISTGNILPFVMSMSGLLGAFWSTHYFIVGKYSLPTWMISLSTYCYGIYICQQFILKYLYYHTSLPEMTGPYLLPWIALIITLVSSIIITGLMLKSRIGRFLIG